MTMDEYDRDEIRGVVLRFAFVMEEKLRENDWQGGWHGVSISNLLECIREETDELEQALQSNDPRRIAREAADVANYAMMVADNAAASLVESRICTTSEEDGSQAAE